MTSPEKALKLALVTFPQLSPWFVGGVLALGLAGLTLLVGPRNSHSVELTPGFGIEQGSDMEQESQKAPCGPETLPDAGVCVPVPLK